ncbi:uncharacterized protein LOC131217204 isoform X1 [Magnolia sinica]|uniref:uncharacterized protein LOC131217204 isoform X1 n=1 Tax=Magnolia sinica TaxID=86752 RepID=UPI00265A45D1|nr:uncharacterized protein LOC131217204 isoform X1 [Magnolia sinica]XP_058068024.1 uncharacterized protein LOC131217204 isoform X1 [Magnolia sinica]
MAISRTAQISLAVATFGSLAFILGVIAENKKPAAGTPIHGKDVVICKYPSDPTVALGSLSVVALFVSTILGLVSIFYPYKGKSVPTDALFRSTTLVVFFVIAVERGILKPTPMMVMKMSIPAVIGSVSVLAEAMMIWASVTEGLHRVRNVHHNLDTGCPTAKTGLFGGAAFLALDAALFWLVCQMLTLNARDDYLEEEDPKGEYGQVLATDYENGAGTQPKV